MVSDSCLAGLMIKALERLEAATAGRLMVGTDRSSEKNDLLIQSLAVYFTE
jgi:hypothetical protein